jgi:hypothetical protein
MIKLLLKITLVVLLVFVASAIITFWQTSNDTEQLIFLLIVSPFGFGAFGIALSRLFYQ